MIAYDATRDALYHPYLRPTVFKPEHSQQGRLLATEAARLAYWPFERDAARRAELQEALRVVGFDQWVPFVAAQTGSQGYGAVRASDGMVLLAFRGTEPDELADLAHDLDASMAPWRDTSARVHHGFADAALSLLPQVEAWLHGLGNQRKRLLVTGHSLGAAIATLLSTVLKPDELITLGSPRVGDAAFTRLMQQLPTRHTRLVDGCDLVTEVPPNISLGGHGLSYQHVGPATYIHADEQGTVQEDVNTDSPEVKRERSQAREHYLLHNTWRRGHVLLRELADHAPINYVRAFLNGAA